MYCSACGSYDAPAVIQLGCDDEMERGNAEICPECFAKADKLFRMHYSPNCAVCGSTTTRRKSPVGIYDTSNNTEGCGAFKAFIPTVEKKH